MNWYKTHFYVHTHEHTLKAAAAEGINRTLTAAFKGILLVQIYSSQYILAATTTAE